MESGVVGFVGDLLDRTGQPFEPQHAGQPHRLGPRTVAVADGVLGHPDHGGLDPPDGDPGISVSRVAIDDFQRAALSGEAGQVPLEPLGDVGARELAARHFGSVAQHQPRVVPFRGGRPRRSVVTAHPERKFRRKRKRRAVQHAGQMFAGTIMLAQRAENGHVGLAVLTRPRLRDPRAGRRGGTGQRRIAPRLGRLARHGRPQQVGQRRRPSIPSAGHRACRARRPCHAAVRVDSRGARQNAREDSRPAGPGPPDRPRPPRSAVPWPSSAALDIAGQDLLVKEGCHIAAVGVRAAISQDLPPLAIVERELGQALGAPADCGVDRARRCGPRGPVARRRTEFRPAASPAERCSRSPDGAPAHRPRPGGQTDRNRSIGLRTRSKCHGLPVGRFADRQRQMDPDDGRRIGRPAAGRASRRAAAPWRRPAGRSKWRGHAGPRRRRPWAPPAGGLLGCARSARAAAAASAPKRSSKVLVAKVAHGQIRMAEQFDQRAGASSVARSAGAGLPAGCVAGWPGCRGAVPVPR